MQGTKETPVQSLGQEDPLEEGTAGNTLQDSCLENPKDRGARQESDMTEATEHARMWSLTPPNSCFLTSYNRQKVNWNSSCVLGSWLRIREGLSFHFS